MTEALKFMEQTERQLSVGVHQIIESLKEGLEFSESIRPLIEAQAYHQLLIAEKHGQLSEVLEELARFDRLRMKQLKKIKAMLVYPLFLCLILGVLIMMIRVFVFPQIQQLMPDDPVQSAPSLGMQLVKLLPLPILIGALIFIGYWSRLDAISRAQFIVKVPLIGKLFRKYIAYYLASNLATLLRNGLSVKEIYATLSEFKSGSLIHLLGEKLHAALMEGQSVKNLVNRHKFIPNEIVKFMTSGNTIPEMANSMTAYSKLMFDEMILATDKMIAFIQPAMFVLIGVTIVGTYFQLLIPIYNSVKGMYWNEKQVKKMRSGFTLIEMTIVLFIISLLILIIIPNLSNQRKHAQSVHSSAMSEVVQAQVDAYFSQHPMAKTVSFPDLVKGGYLTAKQVKQAKDEGLKISHNEVQK